MMIWADERAIRSYVTHRLSRFGQVVAVASFSRSATSTKNGKPLVSRTAAIPAALPMSLS